MREEKSIKKKRERESEYRNKGYYYTKRAKLCSTNAVQRCLRYEYVDGWNSALI